MEQQQKTCLMTKREQLLRCLELLGLAFMRVVALIKIVILRIMLGSG